MRRSALALGVAVALAAPCVAYDPVATESWGTITPTCGAATVDGFYADWNLLGDEVVPLYLYNGANPTATELAKVYWRYDSSTEKAYVLVLAEPDQELIEEGAEVRIYDFGGNQISAAAFDWVMSGDKTVGFEASFSLPTGAYDDVEVRAHVSGSAGTAELASTGVKSFKTWDLQASGLGCVGIGNRVWREVNGVPGYQPETGSPGGPDVPLPGVTVQVRNASDHYVNDATTDTNGCYVVEGLTSGKTYTAYILPDDLPSGLVPVARAYPDNYTTDDLVGNELTDDDRASAVQNPASAQADQNGLQYGAFEEVSSDLVTVTVGAAPTDEEAGRNAGSCASVRTLPDNAVNETIDFAFEAAVGIGNRVWIEKNSRPGFQGTGHPDVISGLLVADEPRAGVSVELLRLPDTQGAAPTRIGGDVTDAEGCYLIERSAADAAYALIPDGDYFVRIPQENFALGGALVWAKVTSYTNSPSVDDGGSIIEIAGVNYDAGDQDGRADGTSGAVLSQQYTLKHGEAPTTHFALDGSTVSGPGGTPCDKDADSILPANSVNLTADFSFAEEKVAIGNLVWRERNGTAGFQGTGPNHDVGIDGVMVTLHSDSGATKTFTTAGGGFYLFDQLTPGKYYVEVASTEFNGVLKDFEPLIGPGGDDENDDAPGNSFASGDHNADGNGPPKTAGVQTNFFDLEPGNEPQNESGAKYIGLIHPELRSSLPDSSVNLTADLAFFDTDPDPTELSSVGSTLWIDANWNGVQDKYRHKDPVTGVVTEIPEPVIAGCQVTVRGPIDDYFIPQRDHLTNTGANGTYFVGGLEPGKYEVSISDQNESGIACVTKALADFYSGLEPGLPLTLAVHAATTAHLTWAGAPNNPADDQIDGDNNGLQTLPGARVYSPQITLTAAPDADEPVDDADPSHTGIAGVELTFANDTAGRLPDNGSGDPNPDPNPDLSGDMTVDFGLIHQCAAICDMDGDGKVTNYQSTHPSGAFSSSICKDPLTKVALSVAELVDEGVSDTDIIRCLNKTDRTWASTSGKGPGAGQPGSGDCDSNGINSSNDAAWCEVFVQPPL